MHSSGPDKEKLLRTMKPKAIGALVLATLMQATGVEAQTEHARGPVRTMQPNIERRRLSPEDLRKVAPALEAYTQERLYGEVWKRPGSRPALEAWSPSRR